MHIKHAIRTRFHDFHIMNDWPLQMTFFLTKHKSLYGFSPLNGPDDALEPFIHFDHSLNVPLHVFHELSLPWRFCSWKHFWGVPLLDSRQPPWLCWRIRNPGADVNPSGDEGNYTRDYALAVSDLMNSMINDTWKASASEKHKYYAW